MTPKATKFLAKNPTLICRIHGVRFYEHPTRGDESPLLAILPDGRLIRTDFWDRPHRDDVWDMLAEREQQEA